MAMPNGGLSPWGQARLRKRLDPGVPFRMGRRVRRRVAPAAAIERPLKFPRYFADQPTRKFCKLKYVEHIGIQGPNVNAITANEFRANGMYDPRYAVGGHQPMGFDQLMAQYNHFTVLRSVFKVENMNSENYNDVCLCAALSAEAGAVAASYAAGGRDGLREMPITSQDTMMQIGQYDQKNRSVSLYFNASKFFGKPNSNLIGDARFQGDATADPTEDAFFTVFAYAPNNTDESAKVFPIKIEITYFAVFTEPKWFTTS